MRLSFDKKSREELTTTTILFLLASSGRGMSVFEAGASFITLFYLVAVFLILKWVWKHPSLDMFQLKVLLWAIFAVGTSIVLGTNVNSLSVLHFCFYIIAAISLLSVCNITKRVIWKLSNWFIYLNLINVIIAVFLYNIGVSNIPDIFGTFFNRGVMRYMGFTTEPSYLAMESTVCILACMVLRRYDRGNGPYNTDNFKWLIIAYFMLIILAKTSFGVFSIAIVGVFWFSYSADFSKLNNKFLISWLIGLIIVAALGICIMLFSDNIFVSRVLRVFDVLSNSGSLNEFQEKVGSVEGSTWYRFGPLFLAYQAAKLNTLQGLLGYGIGTDAEYYTQLLASKTIIRGGFLQGGFHNHGLIGLLLFLYIVIKRVKAVGIVGIVYLLLCFTNCSISTQAFWFIVIMYVSTVKILKREKLYGDGG